MLRRLFFVPTLLALLIFVPRAARAENEGQHDLDKATEAKIAADSPDDLAEVIRLCRSALKAGLDESNTKFANTLLVGTLVQRGEIYSEKIFGPRGADRTWPRWRKLALEDLNAALEVNADQAEAQLLVGRLEALPGGDKKKALTAIDAAVKLSDREPSDKAKALMLRANLTEDKKQRLTDLDEAIKLAPNMPEPLRARALYYLSEKQPEKASADLDAAIKLDPSHAETLITAGLVLTLDKNYEEALKRFDRAVELAPKSGVPRLHRARVFALQGNMEKALADANEAAELEPQSPGVYVLRAELYQELKQPDKALADVTEALRLNPTSIEALQMILKLCASMHKYGPAIAALERLEDAPNNDLVLIQLGMLYNADKQRDKALEVYAILLHRDDQNEAAYRGRADVYLGQGKQAEAIGDYEKALKIDPTDSGVLNNLAWVLATSPNDKIRDGARAVELAKSACDLTKYKQAHIISTLAASYAEKGDFDSAIKWSKDAVKLGKGAIKTELGKELASYEAHKPWREAVTPDIIADAPDEDDEEADDAAKPAEPTQPDADTTTANEKTESPK